MNASSAIPRPIEIDPNPCEHCGRTIDQHRMVDDGDGPEFFCRDDGDLVRQWEMNDCRDRWKWTGEKPPSAAVRNSDIGAKPARPEPYRPADSTVAAFWYVVGLNDTARLTAWMRDHPKDAPALLKLLEGK